MKNKLVLYIMCFALLTSPFAELFADGSRGLWACKDGNKVFVSWRMRATDSPKSTTYKLYADGNLVSTLTDRTNVTLSTQYQNSTFSLEVLDRDDKLIDSHTGVKCVPEAYHSIRMEHPANYRLPDGSTVEYHPYDCSAYDMDGDGEQEIIVNWSAGEGELAKPTAPPILDCYKLDGTRLWRIDIGPNVVNGCRFTFLCYDFDSDGYGELIIKTAQGSKDATGRYLSTGPAKNANHQASSVNSSGVITDAGQEWITCYSGVTGKELATIDYWPYFNIQRDWDDRPTYQDGSTYGHRGNWMKGCVAFLDVNGKPTPCFVTTRGIYTYSYAAAYSWDGKSLNNLWKHSSDVQGQGIYGQGAHSITCGDVDGDGFDEIIVGAACLDHDGKLLWRTGFGHGDATHLGEFDPSNDGMEYYMITEDDYPPYDCALLDAKTGKVLSAKKITDGDTGRGLIMDCDGNYDGSEYFCWSYPDIYTCKGDAISEWHVGSTKSSSINFRIYWDGDLLDEYSDRGHVDKWNSGSKTWDRVYTYGYKVTIDGTYMEWGANMNNATKYNCCLQADIIGDWREESIFWTSVNDKYYITIYHSTIESKYKLPWLRDDHVYDMAVAWQNCGYNQPPHLGYSPVEYYKKLENQSPATIGRWGSGGARNQTVNVGSPMTATVYNFTNAESVKVIGLLPPGVTATVQNGQIRIEGTPTEPGVYQYSLITVGAYDGNEVTDTGGTITVPYGASSLSKENLTNASQEVCQDSAIADIYFSWDNAQTVEVTGLPNGLIVEVDDNAKKVHIYGTIKDELGEYPYTIQTVGGNPNASIEEKIIVKRPEYTDVSDVNLFDFNVLISPNPLVWQSTLSVMVNVPCVVRYSMVDLLGQVVLQASHSAEVGENTYTLHRTDLKSGVYMLQVMVGNELRCLRLIVQ